MIIPFNAEYIYTPTEFRKGWRVVVTDTKTDNTFLFDSAWYTEEEANQLAEAQYIKDKMR